MNRFSDFVSLDSFYSGIRGYFQTHSELDKAVKFAFIFDHIYAYAYIKTGWIMSPAQFFKCLSDDTRLRCITLLQKEGKLCVCELTHALALSQPKISRHLASLRQYGLLQDSREGQWVYYQINPNIADWAMPLLDAALVAVECTVEFKYDLQRLKQMENRPELAECC